MDKCMKLWLIYANAGGGHRQPADALAEELTRKHQAETICLDVSGNDRSVLKFCLEEVYKFIIDYVPWLYRLIYETSKWRPIMKLENYLVVAGQKKFFIEKLKEGRPEKIVVLFYFFGPLVAALRELKLEIPLTAVVTDPYTTHPLWFLYKEFNYVVFSEQIKQTAIACGVPAQKVKVFPQIIHKKFKIVAETGDQESIRSQLGLPKNKKIVLLIGGANGLPGGAKALRELFKSGLDAHFVVVAGKNKQLYNRAVAVAKKYGPASATVYGYVDFVEQLMIAADVVIGKAGASVMMETLLLKKPMIIISYIWGQEEGNVDFVVKNKLGFFEPDISKLPSLVRGLLENPESGVDFGDQQKNRLIASGTEAIAEYICHVS